MLTDENVCPTLVRMGACYCGAVAFACQPILSQREGAWDQYCRLHTARRDVIERDRAAGTEGTDAQYARPGRLSGYLYTLTKNAAYAKKAWSGVRIPRVAGAQWKGPDVVTPIEDVPALSTNSVVQGCLEAIEVLEMCGDQMG